jgi:hypothetical protein
MAYISHPRVSVASKGFHMKVTTKMCVNRMATQLENTGKYAGGEAQQLGEGRESTAFCGLSTVINTTVKTVLY